MDRYMGEQGTSVLRCNGGGEALRLNDPNDLKWNLSQEDTTHFVGFDAIVAGAIIDDGTFWFGNTSALFWTSTETSDSTAWVVGVHQSSTFHRCDDSKKYGTAVRCIKEE